MLSAVVFDFDGIIVNTEPLHYQAFQEVLVPLGYGYSWDEYVRTYIGFDDRDAFREVFRFAETAIDDRKLHLLIEKKALAFQKIIAAGVESYPGVVELIRAIAGKIPLALCSGALPSDIRPILGQLDLDNVFDVVVTATDVKASKPDPESYTLAVKKLTAKFPEHGIVPADCLAIEDTPAGIASAARAGLKVLAVTNSYPGAKLGKADKIVKALAGIDLHELRQLFMP